MTAVFRAGALARRGLVLAALLFAGLGAASLRTLHLGNEAEDAAEAAFDRGDLAESIRWARRAANLTVPGASHPARAYVRLEVIARGAEAVGQVDLSIAAWDAIRAAALESSYPGSAERPDLERVNRNLARLRTRKAVQQPVSVAHQDAERELLQKLDEAGGRAPGTPLLALGFVLGVLGLGFAGVWGVSTEGRLSPSRLVIGVAITAIGVACWTFAVYTA